MQQRCLKQLMIVRTLKLRLTRYSLRMDHPTVCSRSSLHAVLYLLTMRVVCHLPMPLQPPLAVVPSLCTARCSASCEIYSCRPSVAQTLFLVVGVVIAVPVEEAVREAS